jgi:hypothetical protein
MKPLFKNINDFSMEFGFTIKSGMHFDRKSSTSLSYKRYTLKNDRYDIIIDKKFRCDVFINKIHIGNFGSWDIMEKKLIECVPELFKHFIRKRKIESLLNEK